MVGKFVKRIVRPTLMVGHNGMIQVTLMIVVLSMTLIVTLMSTVT